MAKILSGGDGAMRILRALGLPEETSEFEFTMRAGQSAELRVTMYVTDSKAEELIAEFKRYRLIEIESDPPQLQQTAEVKSVETATNQLT